MVTSYFLISSFFFFQAEDGIRDWSVTGVQTCALPISLSLALMYWPWPMSSPTPWARLSEGEQSAGSRLVPRSEERRVGKSVDLGGRRIIKKKKTIKFRGIDDGVRVADMTV